MIAFSCPEDRVSSGAAATVPWIRFSPSALRNCRWNGAGPKDSWPILSLHNHEITDAKDVNSGGVKAANRFTQVRNQGLTEQVKRCVD